MGCMAEKEHSGVCEKCGYDGTENNAPYLPVGTLLSERYIIGKLLSFNGEGAVYIAYDTVDGTVVDIKEFMPDTLCERAKDSGIIVVKDDCLPLYKSYLSEFADLYKTLMANTEGSCIRRAYSIFAANNTGYVVMEHIDGVSLTQYLAESGAVMSWGEAKELFRPVFDSLETLHSKGIVHRGLSTDSIYMTENGELAVTSIGISASRTADSRIECEMFDGYTACEQYALSERQGSWTDVYGISAVLYRVLTGKTPLGAREREENDALPEAELVNPDIPHAVSRAIADGMITNASERIHSISDLVKRLYAAPVKAEDDDMGGPVTPPVAAVRPRREEPRSDVRRRPQQQARRSSKKEEKKSNIPTLIGLGIFLAFVIALIVAIIWFADKAVTPGGDQTTTTTSATTSGKPSTTTPPVSDEPIVSITDENGKDKLLMPNFVNRFYSSNFESNYSMLKFIVEFEINDEYAENMIFEQSIDPSTEVSVGTEVTIKVSSGPSTAPLPDYVGLKFTEYIGKLNSLGIAYKLEREESTEFKADYVIRCDVEVGEEVPIRTAENPNPDPITVYYAVAPKVTTTTTTTTTISETAPPEVSDTEDTTPEQTDPVTDNTTTEPA